MPPLYKSWDPPRRVPRQVDDILRLRTPSSSEARRTREPSSKAVALGNQSVPDSGRIFLPCLNYQREIRLSVDLPMPRCRKCRLGCLRSDTQVGFSRQMTANPDLGIRFWTPSSVFVALPPLRQPAPPPAICGDSVAALAPECAQSPMVFSTTRDGPQAQKGSAHGHSRRELLPHRPRHGPLQPARGRGRRPLRRLELLPRLRRQAVGDKLQAAQAAPQAPSARSARFSSGASEDEARTWAKTPQRQERGNRIRRSKPPKAWRRRRG